MVLMVSLKKIKEPLLEPYQIKHLRLKNRIMITSHEPAYPEEGLPKERYIAYHEARAKGGVALSMTAGSAVVSKDSPPTFNNVLAYKDEVVPWLKRLTDCLHSYDCAAMIQLTHLGRRTGWDKGDWLPSLAPTHEREPAHLYAPKRIEDWDIVRIIKDFSDAAERMKAGGMDGIELEAYGHLIDQFFSPLSNELEGGYGGQFDRRVRFLFDVLKAVRVRVGAEFIVGVRFVADEVQKGGLNAQEGLEIGRRLAQSGLVDFINIIRGRIHTDAALTDVIPVQGMASAPHLDFAGHLRQVSGLPTFHAAKIADIATARHAINSGLVDMVGMTRAHMADPDIVRKLMAREESSIRPCVGATYCLDRIYQGGEALCIHNPATGRELTMPHAALGTSDALQHMMIIGAGPAGLEAARVASARGHRVDVFEAAPEAGGQVQLCARSPRRRDMMGIIDWRMEQCLAQGVAFHFNQWMEAEQVFGQLPDVVIVATGGFPDTDVWVENDAEVISAWDILSGNMKMPAHESDVLIYDETGDHSALQAAEILANSGACVEIVTPDRRLSPDIMGMNLVPYMRNLQDKAVEFTVARRLLSVSRQKNQLCATLGTDYSDHTYQKNYAQIIVNKGIRPLESLYFDLKPHARNQGAVDYEALIRGAPQSLTSNPKAAFQLFRIGDAVSARNIHAAVYDALRLMITF